MSRTKKNGSDTLFLMIGIAIGSLLITAIVQIAGATYWDGYRQAYRDSKKGVIEETIKQKCPSVWIEYNATESKR